jgi:MFS family permease
MSSKMRPDSASAEFEVVQEAPRFQRVYWMKEPHLRKLYGMTLILMVASATTGYDGMLVNTSQQIDLWNDFFFPERQKNPDLRQDPALDSKLAILVNMFNIGSIISFFITPYIADNFGRKTAIKIGCVFMIAGGFLTALSTGYGSECPRLSCWVGFGPADNVQCTWEVALSSALATRSPRWRPRCC